jgi:transposase-like protein
MARKATIDVDKAMQMLLEGQSTQAVADHFGVTRQAIDLHRRKLIQTGLIADRRARRTMTAAPARTGRAETPQPERKMSVPLDGMIDLAIEAFGSLKRLPQLEAELAMCRQENEKAIRRIEELEQELDKRKNQESRWKLAVTGDAFLPSKDTRPDSSATGEM